MNCTEKIDSTAELKAEINALSSWVTRVQSYMREGIGWQGSHGSSLQLLGSMELAYAKNPDHIARGTNKIIKTQ